MDTTIDDAATHQHESDEGILRVSASSAPQAVASAINQCIFSGQRYPSVRAIGHGAVGQACKAIAIASGYAAQQGVHLAVSIGFETVKGRTGDDITAQVFHLFRR